MPLKPFVKTLRPHQWSKNTLVLAALFTSHRFVELPLMLDALVAFTAYSLCASSCYVLNDLLDRDADRRHRVKRHRPIASGAVSTEMAIFLTAALGAAGFAAAFALPVPFRIALAVHWVLATLYSLLLKKHIGIDVIALAILYTLRVIAGGLAVAIPASFWLLSFSLFLFLSLAMLKRYSEVLLVEAASGEVLVGRGYRAQDRETLRSLGTASSYVAVLVLALYINSPDVVLLYARVEALWLLCPVLLYWSTRIWIKADRGEIDADPVFFALIDRVSWGTLGAGGLILAIATGGL